MMEFRRFFLSVVLCSFKIIELCESAVFFPTNSAYGIFAAIAVPLDLPHRNVFLSYNFEANYNLPFTWGIPPVAFGVQDEDLFDDNGRYCSNCTLDETAQRNQNDEKLFQTTTTATRTTEETFTDGNTTTNEETTETPTEKPREKRSKESPAQRSLLSRTHFYHILMDKFQRSGYQGESCLLRLICETNSSELGDINGILGNLVHIIFSPSTSAYEELPLAYYQAEIDGIHEHCEHYIAECKDNLLDLISKPLVDIIETMMPSK